MVSHCFSISGTSTPFFSKPVTYLLLCWSLRGWCIFKHRKCMYICMTSIRSFAFLQYILLGLCFLLGVSIPFFLSFPSFLDAVYYVKMPTSFRPNCFKDFSFIGQAFKEVFSFFTFQREISFLCILIYVHRRIMIMNHCFITLLF